MDSRLYWVWLSQALRPGEAAIEPLLERFGDAAGVYAATAEELRALPIAQESRDWLADKSLTAARRILERTVNEGIWVLTPEDVAYPEALSRLPDRPAVLYGRGTMPDLTALPGIGMVGTRRASEQGMRDAFRIAAGLAAAGATVISGGAVGIDAAVHSGALDGGGVTVAVLACPPNEEYPAPNTALRRAILAQGGALVSEFAPGEPYECIFPIRNRLIAGMSQGVCLGETPARSGAGTTARLAREMGRDLFAIPGTLAGHINDGCHREIRMGAALVTCAADILREYAPLYPGLLDLDAAAAAEARIERQERGLPPIAVKAGGEERKERRKAEKDEKSGKKRRRSLFERKAAEQDGGDEPVKEEKHAPEGASPDALTAWQALSDTPVAVDELSAAAGLPVPRLLAALTELEMLGAAKNSAGQKYTRG